MRFYKGEPEYVLNDNGTRHYNWRDELSDPITDVIPLQKEVVVITPPIKKSRSWFKPSSASHDVVSTRFQSPSQPSKLTSTGFADGTSNDVDGVDVRGWGGTD
jgi:hypothetical protein